MTAIINSPRGMFFDGTVVAIAGDRTFLTAASPGSAPVHPKPCITQFYTFQLNGAGQPGPLTPLHITVPGQIESFNGLSASRNGRLIAYNAEFLFCGGQAGPSVEIGVINANTRQVRIWTGPPKIDPTIFSVALSADGRELAFMQFIGDTFTLMAVRTMPINAPPGPLDRRSRVVLGPASWVALNADGRSLYACQVRYGLHGRVAYDVYSIASGQHREIASFPRTTAALCEASLDPSGRYLLIELNPLRPAKYRLVVVGLRTRERTSLPPGHSLLDYGGEPESITW